MAEHIIEKHELGATVATELAIEQGRREGYANGVRDALEGRIGKGGTYHGHGSMVLALQYWAGDEGEALELARFLADIEPCWRADVLLLLSRRGDCPASCELQSTQLYVGKKFPIMTMATTPERTGSGHPHGSNELWMGTVEALAEIRAQGKFRFNAVFTFEADGVPMSRDWIDRLGRAHALTRAQGKRVTGALMEFNIPHINGNLVIDFGVWNEHRSLETCPHDEAWDIYHAGVLTREARPCSIIRNEYGIHGMTLPVFGVMARETAWLHGCKDGSALRCARAWLSGAPFNYQAAENQRQEKRKKETT